MQLKPVSYGKHGEVSYFYELFSGSLSDDGLVALGVAGDAFLYRRAPQVVPGRAQRGSLILVDGGGSGKNLRDELNAHAGGQKYLDIVVCTHGDSDHSGGLATFLDKWGYRPGSGPNGRGAVGEFWLPGRWVGMVRAFIADPKPFVDGLQAKFDDLRRAKPNWQDWTAQQIEDDIAMQAVAATAAPDEYSDKSDIDNFGKDPEEVDRKALAGQRGRGTRLLNKLRHRVHDHHERRKIGTGFRDYWISIIDTVDQIRLIGYQAVRHGSRIRWFDYDSYLNTGKAGGGLNGVLTPINAIESKPIIRSIDVLYMIQLSRINQQSLVFYAPQDSAHLGVLFCGDSPMGFGPGYTTPFGMPTVPSKSLLVTTPHHGSSSNDIAYKHIHNWKNKAEIKWIRSGGETQHPDGVYNSFPKELRSCTNCHRHPYSENHTAIGFVHVKKPSESWVQLMPKRDCDCK